MALLLVTYVVGRLHAHRPLPATESRTTAFTLGAAGPWGQLDCTPLRIDLPDDFVSLPTPGQPPVRWFFKGYSRQRALEFLRSAGVAPAELGVLQAARWESESDGVSVAPGDDVILSLAPAARATIYSLLISFPENLRQMAPICFRPGQVEEAVKDSGLSPSSLDLLKRLLYPQGSSLLLFTDMATALRRLPDARERRRFVQAVARKQTLLARLKINADSNLESIIDYWSVGGRKKDVAPLLKALRHSGGGNLQVLCLLPPFVRQRLYTYSPPTGDSATEAKQDCFWTAMNFFSPPGKLVSDTHHVETLNKEYDSISAPTPAGRRDLPGPGEWVAGPRGGLYCR